MRKARYAMKIELINGYFVVVETLCYTLKQRYISQKTGKEATRTFGYFDNLEHSLDKFLRLNQIDVLSDMGMGMFDYVKKVEESNRMAVQTIMSVLGGCEDDGK